jgi:hypothetical protein
VAFRFTTGRGGEHPAAHLAGYEVLPGRWLWRLQHIVSQPQNESSTQRDRGRLLGARTA